MKYKIVADSCCDLSEDSELKDIVEKIPLTLYLGDKTYVDDETFNQKEFIKDVSESDQCAKSACPSPARFMEAYEGDYDCVFVVTISANLSGSYNSAMVGRDMYYDEHENDEKRIYVFDSCSASCGEVNIARCIYECANEGCSYDEIVNRVNKYRDEMVTYFVIETLEPLRKNGRLSNLQAVMASVLNIKPVMYSTDEGLIAKLDQARGMEKAIMKMIKYICEKTANLEEKVLAITHINCLERALWVKDEILKLARFKDITIANGGGVSTLYGNDGGIILAV